MNRLRTALHQQMQNGGLYAVLAALGFSFKAIFVKLGYAAAPVDAITLLALRMGLSLPLFIWLTWASRREASAPLTAGDCLRVAVLGMLGYYLSSLFDFYGLQSISASLERLILFTYPTLVLIFQALVQRERPTLRTLVAMGLCYVGLGVAFVHDLGAGGGQQVLVGSLWVFGSAVTYALFYSGSGLVLKRMGGMRMAGLCGVASSLMVLAHFLVVGDTQQVTHLPSAVWVSAGLMALFSTVLPIYWMALAIQRMGPTHTAAVGNLGPVLTMLASWAILHEAISGYQVAGLVLVLLGVARLRPRKAVVATGNEAAA